MSILELALETVLRNRDIEGLSLIIQELKATGCNVDKLERTLEDLITLWTYLSEREQKVGSYE